MKITHRYTLMVVPPILLLILGIVIANNLPSRRLVLSVVDNNGILKWQANSAVYRENYSPGFRLDLETQQFSFAKFKFRGDERYRNSDNTIVLEYSKNAGMLRQIGTDGQWESLPFETSIKGLGYQHHIATQDLVGLSRPGQIEVINARTKLNLQYNLRTNQSAGWIVRCLTTAQNGKALGFLIQKVSQTKLAAEGKSAFKLIEVDSQLKVEEKWSSVFEDSLCFLVENQIYRLHFPAQNSNAQPNDSRSVIESYDIETGAMKSSRVLPPELKDSIAKVKFRGVQIKGNLIFLQSVSRAFSLSNLTEIKLPTKNLIVHEMNADGSIIVCFSEEISGKAWHLLDGGTNETLVSFHPIDGLVSLKGRFLIYSSDQYGGTFRVADKITGKILYDKSPFAWVLWIVPAYIFGTAAWVCFAVRALESLGARWAWFVILATLTITVTPCVVYLNCWNPAFNAHYHSLTSSAPFLPAVAAGCLWLAVGTVPLRWRVLPLSLLLIGSVIAAKLEHYKNMLLLHECFQVTLGFLPVCLALRWLGLFPGSQISSRYRVTTRDFFMMTALLGALLVVAGNFEGYVKGSSFSNISKTSLVSFAAVQSMFGLALFLSLKRAHKTCLCLALLMAVVVCIDFEYHWITTAQPARQLEAWIWIGRAVLVAGILGFAYLPCAVHACFGLGRFKEYPIAKD